MDEQRLKSILESLLLVSGEPVSLDQFKEVLGREAEESVGAVDKKAIASALQALMEEYRNRDRGLQLVEISGGFQLVTRPENAPWVRRLQTVKTATKLSRPALETLSIVAYRQPVSTPEIEAVRGVDCSGVLKTLLERRLVKIVGRKDVVGKPVLYGTTQEFLQYFGLRDLSELPPLKELQELPKDLPEAVAVGPSNGESNGE